MRGMRGILGGFFVALACAGLAHAQAYPQRPLRVVVPYPAGSGTDIVARSLSQKLGEQLGQGIVIDNRPGGGSLIGMELLKSMTGIQVTHVPYKGSPAALLDVIAGRMAVMFNIVSSTLPHRATGRLRALAISGITRSALLPDVPTVAEAGVPGYEVVSWHGVLAPARTPQPVVDRLHKELRRLLDDVKIRGTLESQGFDARGERPEEFARFIATEVDKWTRVIRQSGATVD